MLAHINLYNQGMTQVAVKGQIWSYQEIGGPATPKAKAGEAIIILHGWGRSGNEWLRMAKDLSDWSGRKVYVLDLPGFGGSSTPRLVKSIYDYSQLVVEFCKYLGLAKVIVIGHSLGGRVGIVMASHYSFMVEKLILVDPAGVKPKSIRRVLMRVLAKLFGWVPKSLRRKIADYAMDEDYHNSPALQEMYLAIVKHDLRGELSAIVCMTQLVWGEQDQILPLSLTKVYRKLLPQSRLRVVWGVGHDPHLTKYEQTLAILQEVCE
jgi:pimeloyl-ACP methyl ester carboxylesterase